MKAKKKKEITIEVVKQKEHNAFYRIIITSQNKIMISVFKTFHKSTAIEAFNKIIEDNKKTVRFPIRYSSRDHKLMKSKYELLLMTTKTEDHNETPLLRNEYGQLVPHIANSNKMIIYKKEEYLFEESFWVYGFNPKSQRKDFNYILNEILLKDLPNVKYPVKTVIVYKNKLIIENDDDFEMVICKCENDSARLYTELEKELTKKKIKSVFFSGMAVGNKKLRIEDKIQEKTTWDKKKVQRSSTRP
jgi:hypothetical protein